MTIESVARQLQILWRTDRIVADIHLRHLLSSVVVHAAAALVAAFGLLLLELAAYFSLVQFWSAIPASAALGMTNLLIAGILVLIARRRPSSRELALATEVHKATVESLVLDARSLQTDLSSLFRNPFSGLVSSLLPLVPALMKAVPRSASQNAK